MERDPDTIRGRCTLYGEDARRFEEEMKRVDNMSKEERRANAEALEKRYQEACKALNLTIKI